MDVYSTVQYSSLPPILGAPRRGGVTEARSVSCVSVSGRRCPCYEWEPEQSQWVPVEGYKEVAYLVTSGNAPVPSSVRSPVGQNGRGRTRRSTGDTGAMTYSLLRFYVLRLRI